MIEELMASMGAGEEVTLRVQRKDAGVRIIITALLSDRAEPDEATKEGELAALRAALARPLVLHLPAENPDAALRESLQQFGSTRKEGLSALDDYRDSMRDAAAATANAAASKAKSAEAKPQAGAKQEEAPAPATDSNSLFE